MSDTVEKLTAEMNNIVQIPTKYSTNNTQIRTDQYGLKVTAEIELYRCVLATLSHVCAVLFLLPHLLAA